MQSFPGGGKSLFPFIHPTLMSQDDLPVLIDGGAAGPYILEAVI